MHPGYFGELAIVAWKSPITGTVTVSGFFSDIDPNCGDGIVWSVDKGGGARLTSGAIGNGEPPQSYSIAGVPVIAGQALYFVVGAGTENTPATVRVWM